jgi:hypothetical protein
VLYGELKTSVICGMVYEYFEMYVVSDVWSMSMLNYMWFLLYGELKTSVFVVYGFY